MTATSFARRVQKDPEFRKRYNRQRYEARKRRMARDPEYRHKVRRREHLRFKYGMTPAQFDALYEAQRGRCAICRTEGPLDVDHDHATEEVRGLLCRDCNLGIGRFKDQPERLESAIRYLRFGLTV